MQFVVSHSSLVSFVTKEWIFSTSTCHNVSNGSRQCPRKQRACACKIKTQQRTQNSGLSVTLHATLSKVDLSFHLKLMILYSAITSDHLIASIYLTLPLSFTFHTFTMFTNLPLLTLIKSSYSSLVQVHKLEC